MKNIIVISLLLMPVFTGSELFADKAQDEAVKKIEESGGSVQKLAANDERVEVDFHLSQGAKDKDLSPIADLQGVYQVHLGGTGVTDAGLAYLKGLDSIERLNLDKTKITDAGLDIVGGLKTLKYLNLYGTAITDAGLSKLGGLTQLEKLYVWQTKVTDAGAKQLQEKLPNVKIERGWDTADIAKPDKKAEEAGTHK